jgi:hypothetical protein
MAQGEGLNLRVAARRRSRLLLVLRAAGSAVD